MKQAFFLFALLSVLYAPAQITNKFFGMSIGGLSELNIDGTGQKSVWPTSNPGIFRIWDTYGQNPTQGRATFLFWKDINTANGVYDWTVFDKVLDTFKNRGVEML